MHHFCHQSSAWQLNEKTILTLILLNGRRTCLEEESHRSRAVSRRRFSSRGSPTIGGGSTLSARPKRKSKSGRQAGFFAVLWFSYMCVRQARMDRHLALLHFDRLEVVLHCGGQVWCYLFVNHHLDISTFVCLVGIGEGLPLPWPGCRTHPCPCPGMPSSPACTVAPCPSIRLPPNQNKSQCCRMASLGTTNFYDRGSIVQ